MPEELYEGLREEALSRLPRDPNDWQVVALALSLGGEDIGAEDFFRLRRCDVDRGLLDLPARAPGTVAVFVVGLLEALRPPLPVESFEQSFPGLMKRWQDGCQFEFKG